MTEFRFDFCIVCIESVFKLKYSFFEYTLLKILPSNVFNITKRDLFSIFSYDTIQLHVLLRVSILIVLL